jgi:hypothetical protein
MLVEHSFITTREENDALMAADRFLLGVGFTRVGVFDPLTDSRLCRKCGYELKGLPMNQPCPECGVQTVFARRVEYRRGRKSASKAVYRLDQQPQRVFVEFDRGKLGVAASIEPHGKPDALHTDFLLALASLVEISVADPPGSNTVAEVWAGLEDRIKRYNRRKRLPVRIVLWVLGLFLGSLIVVAIIAALR